MEKTEWFSPSNWYYKISTIHHHPAFPSLSSRLKDLLFAFLLVSITSGLARSSAYTTTVFSNIKNATNSQLYYNSTSQSIILSQKNVGCSSEHPRTIELKKGESCKMRDGNATWIRDSTRRRIRVCIKPSEHCPEIMKLFIQNRIMKTLQCA